MKQDEILEGKFSRWKSIVSCTPPNHFLWNWNWHPNPSRTNKNFFYQKYQI